MVRVERWVTGRGVEVRTRVSTDRVVDAAVRANLNGVRDAFGQDTVLGDVGLVEEGCNGLAGAL